MPPFLRDRSPRFWLALMVFVQILIHVPMLPLPPLGQHTWRQVVGNAAARNYFEEDDRFFYPRTDIRLSESDDGAIYHELPLTYWLTGESYKLTGVHNFNARVIPLLFNLILLVGGYWLAVALGYARARALWFAFFLGFSPLFIYYAPTFEPNILGLGFFLTGTALIAQALGEGRYRTKFWTGAVLTLVGTLAKPTFLFFGLPLALLFIQAARRERSWRPLGCGALAGMLILAGNAAVIRHAKALYDASPLDRQIHTPIGPAEHARDWAHVWANIEPAASKWFFEMLVNLGALPFFLVGAYALLRGRPWRSASGRFWLAWLVSFLIFAAFFVVRLKDHDYYITPALVLAAAVSARGAEFLASRSRARKALPWLAALTIAIGYGRVEGRWFRRPEVPKLLLEQPEAITRFLPPDDLVLVSGDKSPIIYLYFLHRKGLSLDAKATPLDELDLSPFHWLVHHGARGELSSEVTETLALAPVATVEDFTVYRIEGMKK